MTALHLFTSQRQICLLLLLALLLGLHLCNKNIIAREILFNSDNHGSFCPRNSTFIYNPSLVSTVSSLESYSTTIVTGFWKLKSNHLKKEDFDRLRNTLSINAPFIIYYDDEEILQNFKEIRGTLPTTFIRRNLNDFICASKFREAWLDGLISLEKGHMMKEAADLDPYHSSWYAWVDTAYSNYKNTDPSPFVWPFYGNLRNLPNNKIIYTSSFMNATFTCSLWNIYAVAEKSWLFVADEG